MYASNGGGNHKTHLDVERFTNGGNRSLKKGGCTLMEYTIISANTLDELIREVNQYIKAGWRPQGGVSVSIEYAYFYQAIIRD